MTLPARELYLVLDKHTKWTRTQPSPPPTHNPLPDFLLRLFPSSEASCFLITTVPPLDYVHIPESQAVDVVLDPSGSSEVRQLRVSL